MFPKIPSQAGSSTVAGRQGQQSGSLQGWFPLWSYYTAPAAPAAAAAAAEDHRQVASPVGGGDTQQQPAGSEFKRIKKAGSASPGDGSCR